MAESGAVPLVDNPDAVDEKPKPKWVIPQHEPRRDISRAKIMVYGPPKIGKSTLASKFPGALFFDTEEGLDWLECHRVIISCWDDDKGLTFVKVGNTMVPKSSFMTFAAHLAEEQPECIPGTEVPLHTLVIDTIDRAFNMCVEHICTINGITSPADLEWGKGWKLVGDEWTRVITKMASWPYGLMMTSHDKQTKIKSQATEIDLIQPSIATTGRRVVQALCDIILYCYTSEVAEVNDNNELTGRVTEQRVMRCQPKNNIIAGDRSGYLPVEMPLNYDKLVEYFPDTPGTTSTPQDSPATPKSGG